MGGWCNTDTTVNQTQTYRPDPRATSAITGALSQAQNVAQTPFQTPQAPVAGFSPDQLQAFQGVRNAQGQAQPYLDEAQDYFSGNRVNQFLNPYAANVMAGMKDLFGQQMSQATGNLTQQAGGVGADRIAVGQAELVRQQQLAAGQTLAGLYQPALSASQNAGFGIGALGPVAQNAALQGAQAQLGTGGLQQQLQQAQMNAPYQQELARIQWPYQNAQFNAGITGALAPGLGGTTTGNTQYPQQSPFGTIAGAGMAGLGAYGASGGFNGLSNLNQGYNYDGSMSGNQWVAAGQGQGPYAAYASGGRINPYADGGAVDDDSMEDQIHAAEIQTLRDAGNPSAAGIHVPQSGVQPINIASQSLIPTGQIPQIQAHIPQLQAPQQQGGGGGFLGGLGSLVGAAAKIIPMLNQGGTAHGYAEGGATEEKKPSYYESFLKALRGINEAIAPTPHTGSIGHDMLAALPFASGALRPSGIRLTPTNTANPRLQVRGRFMSTDPARAPHGNEAMLSHPAVGKWPFIASGQLASNMYGTDDSPSIERMPEPAMRHNDADMMAGAGKGVDESNPFAERWGEMAPPSESPRQDPLFLQSGMTDAPPQAAEHVPLPRSNPFVPMALQYEARKRAAIAPPAPDRAPPYRPMHMADAGVVPGGEEDEFEPPLFLQSGMEDIATPSAGPTRMYRGRPVADWSQRDPDAAYEASKKRWSAIRDNPGEAAMTAASLAAPVAGGVISSALENASDRSNQRGMSPLGGKRTAAPEGVRWPNVSSMLDLSAHAAEDVPPSAPEVPVTSEEKAVIDRIGGAIATERQKLARATQQNGTDKKTGKPLPPSPRMLAISGSIDALQNDLAKVEGPQSPLGMRRAAALDVHKENVKAWNESQAALKNRKTESQLPYAVKYPERQENIQKYMPWVSGGTGAALGLLGKGKVLKPLAASTAVGAAEGFGTAAWPTLQDTEFLPEGQTWKDAAKRFRGMVNPQNADPDFLTRVGAGIGTHALLAGAGSLGASKARDALGQAMEAGSKFRNWAKTPAGSGPQVSDVAQKAVQAASPGKVKTAFTLADGSTAVRHVSNGRTMWRGPDGKIISAPNVSKAKAGQPEHYNNGGMVNPYQTGGSTRLRKDLGYDDIDTIRNDTGYYDIDSGTSSDDGNPFADRFGEYEFVNDKTKPRGSETPHVPAPINVSPSRGQSDEVDPAERSVPMPSQLRSINPYLPMRKDGSEDPTPAMARDQDLVDSPWMALMQAGLGTMAAAGHRDSRGLPTSPAAAIGQGGMKGIEALREQQTARMKQQSVEQAAKRLEAEALRHQRAMGETERHNRATEAQRAEIAGQQWQMIGPTEDGQGIIMLNKKDGSTRVEPVKLGQKAKALPSPIQKDLGEKAQTFQTLDSLSAGFKPEFSGYGSASVGDLANWTARQFGLGNKDAAEWWQQYQAYRNQVRHKLFGSALTGTETTQWEKQDINPGMQPDMIDRNIKKQTEIIENAMNRRADSLVEQGYSKKAIELELGRTLGDTKKPAIASPDSAAIEWAKANPKDPRAQKILQLNGVQ